jgi:hypothetical protein
MEGLQILHRFLRQFQILVDQFFLLTLVLYLLEVLLLFELLLVMP